MKEYKRVLVAVELLPETDAEPLKRAEEFAKKFGAEIALVHAVEHINGYGAYGIGVGFEVEKTLLDQASSEMEALGKRMNIPEANRCVKVGPAKFVILEEAERLDAGLIIVGSHGRHGISMLLGATANAVLHGAKCDVLAVRLKK